ncbi:hypothetical protein ABB37_04446 [Leptomonas pyrrhocoris]|uniref:Cilia- and flagella-associated protein 91 n=1 Tax=Leptomonas pyrrhocoris TaxID=157538 RepID=A0A0N0DVZ3_LEPPY|nr:hypothetical protein ABB37_04446 [Leptomonas pyrrhocoris]KPA81088.1 hypothetical protein ABB37_04446 [Leptomonas pyrrhocoris]|eukprot:XP_015659527.1 hypothetical protein ABB37_04446 [Leptomonas pyrrhocoris]
MYRQQQQNVPGGRGYPTEVDGRDRVKFFRRPVEPDNTVLDRQADTANVQFAASCPSFSMPSNAAAFAGSSMQSRGRGNGLHVRGPRRPSSSSAMGVHPRQAMSANFQGSMSRSQEPSRRRPHHLPSLHADDDENDAVRLGSRGGEGGAQRDHRVAVSVQTVQRENEAQTDPYSPDYFIPEGAPTPEVLSLQSLTYQNGALPAGRQEVQLIQRLRRRREVEAALPTGSDAASVEARYMALHELEEMEWAEREEHVGHLQQRRLDRLKESMLEREAAREESNRARLERIKAQYLDSLGGKLTSLEKRRAASNKRGNEKMAELQAQQQASRGGAPTLPATQGGTGATGFGGTSTRGGPTIASYSRYGISGAPPPMGSVGATLGGPASASNGAGLDEQNRMSRQAFNYDVRPQLLSDVGGTQLVDEKRGARTDRVSAQTFVVPQNDAVQRLPTLYQRREAERVLQSLEYAHKKLHQADDEAAETTETKMQRVLDLYRATPKLQRPDTPVLELDGDDEEEEEDACILLQRLLRGRAVQNDFFEGRERCRGLIEELQAASTAQTAEVLAAEKTQNETEAAEREADLQAVVDTALGAVVHDTLGFLTQELLRQQDIAELRHLQEEAETVRQTREAAELARRAEVRQRRDRNEVAYTAFMRATDTTVRCFLDDVLGTAVEDTALDVAVAEEQTRQAARPSPREPQNEAEAQDVVCDMLDTFLLPTVVEAIVLQHRTLQKKAGAEAAIDAAHAAIQKDGAPEET